MQRNTKKSKEALQSSHVSQISGLTIHSQTETSLSAITLKLHAKEKSYMQSSQTKTAPSALILKLHAKRKPYMQSSQAKTPPSAKLYTKEKTSRRDMKKQKKGKSHRQTTSLSAFTFELHAKESYHASIMKKKSS